MAKRMSRLLSFLLVFCICITLAPSLKVDASSKKNDSKKLVLRVANWEEYIDEGDWDEDEAIDLDDETVIFGENSLVDDFEEWYLETYGIEVQVEYSTFGTNEDLYSQLNLGDVYDVVCPSEYMIMKLLSEDKLVPLSDEFFDADNELNYYTNGVSPFIDDVFCSHEIGGKYWKEYAAGYMWGITGFVYNPDEITEEEASTWSLLVNPDYFRQVTIKDNVRDAYFPTVAMIERDKLLDEDFINSDNYEAELENIVNDTSEEMVARALDALQDIRANVYSFETDSGKADMVTGKVVASLQWSGDAVYAMDQAEEDDVYLNFAVPEECTNLWFDGWVMLKSGIEEDSRKQHAAEAFINFLSRPDNAVRNMYYIGYTSSISGGDSSIISDYIDWTYGAEEDEEDVCEYPLGYFFTGDDEDEDYIFIVPTEQTNRQLFGQYPPMEIMQRKAIMRYFDAEANARINQMWIDVRCFNVADMTTAQWIIICFVLLIAVCLVCLSVIKKKRK